MLGVDEAAEGVVGAVVNMLPLDFPGADPCRKKALEAKSPNSGRHVGQFLQAKRDNLSHLGVDPQLECPFWVCRMSL